jgi:hypothetical protein
VLFFSQHLSFTFIVRHYTLLKKVELENKPENNILMLADYWILYRQPKKPTQLS